MITIDKHVTADWARKESQTNLGEKVIAEVCKCLNSIKDAVKENKFECHVSFPVDALTIKDIKARGFQCVKHTGDNQREPDYMTISW